MKQKGAPICVDVYIDEQSSIIRHLMKKKDIDLQATCRWRCDTFLKLGVLQVLKLCFHDHWTKFEVSSSPKFPVSLHCDPTITHSSKVLGELCSSKNAAGTLSMVSLVRTLKNDSLFLPHPGEFLSQPSAWQAPRSPSLQGLILSLLIERLLYGGLPLLIERKKDTHWHRASAGLEKAD